MAVLKQSTSYTRMFMMIDSSDHVTGKTGLTVTATLSKAGAAFGSAGGSVTEVSSGWYKLALNTTDTNTIGDLAYHLTSTGADPTDFVDQVTVQLPGDTTVDVNVAKWNGTTVATPATAGIPDVNAKNINNVATTSVTTINANVGTTQPTNFTGTGASALVKSDMVDVAGAAVSTSSAQIGVNVVQAGATAWNSGAITASTIATDAIDADALATDAVTEIANAIAAPSAATVADAVWDEAGAGHVTAGTFGKIVQDISGGTLSLGATERNAIADALLNRDMSLGADSGSPTVRTPRDAFRALRNKWSITNNLLTVCKEDDSSEAWSSTLSTTANTSPVTSSDPAGP